MGIDNGAHTGAYIVAHAPQNTSTQEPTRSFGGKLGRQISSAPYGATLFMDANRKVALKVDDHHIGPGGYPQKEDRNGTVLHNLPIEHDLFIPSTFVPLSPDTTTHLDNRIDYVSLPMSHKAAILACATIRDLDSWVVKRTIGQSWFALRIHRRQATSSPLRL